MLTAPYKQFNCAPGLVAITYAGAEAAMHRVGRLRPNSHGAAAALARMCQWAPAALSHSAASRSEVGALGWNFSVMAIAWLINPSAEGSFHLVLALVQDCVKLIVAH